MDNVNKEKIMYKFYSPEEINKIKQSINMVEIDNSSKFGIVIDCETLGITPNAVVFNLAGHVFSFDPRSMGSIPLDGLDFYKNYRFPINPQTSIGRTIDENAWEFWCNQNQSKALTKIMSLPRSDFKESIKEFHDWLYAVKTKLKCRTWYRGQDFDHPILKSLFESVGITYQYIRGDAPRDIRSYIDAKLDGVTGFVPGDTSSTELHTALGDCINDIRQMQLCWCLTNSVNLESVTISEKSN